LLGSCDGAGCAKRGGQRSLITASLQVRAELERPGLAARLQRERETGLAVEIERAADLRLTTG
jgi:hypothetical protein